MVATRSQQKQLQQQQHNELDASENSVSSPLSSKIRSARISPRKQASEKNARSNCTTTSTSITLSARSNANGVNGKVNGTSARIIGKHKKFGSGDEDQDVGGVRLGEEIVERDVGGLRETNTQLQNMLMDVTTQTESPGKNEKDKEVLKGKDERDLDNVVNKAVIHSEAEEHSEDDAAPEVISNATSREYVKAKEEETIRTIRRQVEETREKRRQRDVRLKEQREAALKRRRIEHQVFEEAGQQEQKKAKATKSSANGISENFPKPALPTRLDSSQQKGAYPEDRAEIERNTTPTSTTLSGTPTTYTIPPRNKKLPLLLPQFLLEEAAARPSPSPSLPLSVHKKASDFEAESALLKQQKEKRIWKRGPVAVAVLDTPETSQRRSMAPKTVMQSFSVKNQWMMKGSAGNRIEREKARGSWGKW